MRDKGTDVPELRAGLHINIFSHLTVTIELETDLKL